MTANNRKLYSILGVAPSASDAEIKAAYDSLIAQNPEGSPMHDSIEEAYKVLSDIDSRAAYDITGKSRLTSKRRHRIQSNGLDKARYTLNTLFLAGAAATTILFVLQLSGALSSTPFYWVCGASLLVKVAEYILRLIP